MITSKPILIPIYSYAVFSNGHPVGKIVADINSYYGDIALITNVKSAGYRAKYSIILTIQNTTIIHHFCLNTFFREWYISIII